MNVNREIVFEVRGFPPIKNEASSILGEGHSQRPRVVVLLQAAKEEMLRREFQRFAANDALGLEIILNADYAEKNNNGDATNYLGGIGDVLQDKSRLEKQLESQYPGFLRHLGELAAVFLYPDDRQIREVHYRQEPGSEARYTVKVWSR